MEQGRRAEYRVELSDPSELRVAVAVPGGDEIHGQLIDVSASGAGAVFEAPDPPNLAVGQNIDLVFTSDDFSDAVTVAARVQHRAEGQDNDGSRRFGFRFLEPQQLNAHLPAAARRLFNRRQTVRVSPDQYQPIGVTIERCDQESHELHPPVDVRVLNISVGGIGLSLEPTLETAFAATTQLRLVIKLPGIRRTLEFVGDIRYRRLIGQRIHYGIQFNADHTERFGRKQDILGKYVTRRQLDYLRASA
jgi:c-di-GMP-binding flagellar brake protein YcgR